MRMDAPQSPIECGAPCGHLRWQEWIVKLNKGGLISAGVYTVYFVAAYTYGHFTGIKAGAILDQLAVFPGLLFCNSLISLLGISEDAIYNSWLNNEYVFYLGSLVISYLFGWVMSVFINVKDPSSPPVGEDTPDWHKR
jgi:hypothetical protein